MTRRVATALAICLLIPVSLAAQDLIHGPPYVVPLDAQVPSGIAVDSARERLFVLDTGGRRILFVDVEALTELAPTWETFGAVADPEDPEALLEPQGIAVAGNGDLYVADTFHGRLRRYPYDAPADSYGPAEAFPSGTPTSVDGVDIHRPRAVATGSDGRIFLLDSGNERLLVADGPGDVDWAVLGVSQPGWGHAYGLDTRDGNLLAVADTDHHAIGLLTVDTGAASALGHFGERPEEFRFPRGLALHADGTVIVADTYNQRIEAIGPAGHHRFRLGDDTLFHTVVDVAVDDEGHIFALDAGLNRLVAWLCPDVPKPFDLYVRDFVGDCRESRRRAV